MSDKEKYLEIARTAKKKTDDIVLIAEVLIEMGCSHDMATDIAVDVMYE